MSLSTGAVYYPDGICIEEEDPFIACPGYDIKQSDDKAQILKYQRMCNTTLLPLLPVWHWPDVVALASVLLI